MPTDLDLLPPDILFDPKLHPRGDVFGNMKPDCPLTMLPIRIETVFSGGSPPATLHVRVYPDDIHMNDHDTRLTQDEETIGLEFWKRFEAAAGDDKTEQALRAWIIDALSERRAAYVIDVTRTNPATDIKRARKPRPALAACLPKFWRVVGYRRRADGTLEEMVSEDGAQIEKTLCLDPLYGDGKDRDAPPQRNIVWMKDYSKALEFGMAVDVPLFGKKWTQEDGIALLLVYGVNAPASREQARELETLMTAHRFSGGLAFQAQGVPTNSVEDRRSPITTDPTVEDGTLDTVLSPLDLTEAPEANGRRLSHLLGGTDGGPLERVDGAEREEDSGQRWMNEALWPVTWGAYFNALLVDPSGNRSLPDGVVNTARDAFLYDVRGGGPLPALRVGTQPYGILPVRAHHVPTAWKSPDPWFETILLRLRDVWLDGTPLVPKLSARGNGPPDEELTDVVQVLGAQPHPSRFLVRKLRDWRNNSYDDEWASILAAFGLFFLAGNDPHYGHPSLSVLGQWGWGLAMMGDEAPLDAGANMPPDAFAALIEGDFSSAEAQLEFLMNLRDNVADLVEDSDKIDGARVWLDRSIAILNAYFTRLEPLLSDLGNLPLSKVAGVLHDETQDPIIGMHIYDNKTREFTRSLVMGGFSGDGQSIPAQPSTYLAKALAQVPNDSRRDLSAMLDLVKPPVGTTGNTLNQPRMPSQSSARIEGLRGTTALRPAPSVVQPNPADFFTENTQRIPFDRPDEKPLLQQLVDAAVPELRDGERTGFRAALKGLLGLPVPTLEWHLRETLGLASHRLDAWLTALATRRLRDLQPNGRAQYGGYGFVLDLKPDEKLRDSDGYQHAPSTQQAVTAGILRSAWRNHGRDDQASPLAVNLQSDRIRTADRLIQAVAQGRELGDVLGYDFERGLHDKGLDRLLNAIRVAVLRADGKPPRVDGPMDGLSLIEAFDRGDLQSTLDRIKPDTDKTDVETLIKSVKASFDALGDAGLTEAVHYLAQGNATRAAAILDAISLGEAPPSELRHARTDISKSELAHTVALSLPLPAKDAPPQTGLAASHPSLNAFIEPLLLGFSRLTVQVITKDIVHDVPLNALGLSALDLVLEAARPAALGQRAMIHLVNTGAELPPDAYCPTSLTEKPIGSVSPDLEDFEELCVALADHLSSLRPLMPDALTTGLPNRSISLDQTALSKKLKNECQNIKTAADHLEQVIDGSLNGAEEQLLNALADLAKLGFPAALPGTELIADPHSHALRVFARSAVKAARKRSEAASSILENAPSLDQCLALAKKLSGNRLPAEVKLNGGTFGPRNGIQMSPLAVELADWAGKYAHIRPDLRRWTRAVDTARLLAPDLTFNIKLRQHSSKKLPRWMGLHLPPEGSDGGSSWVLVDGGGVPKLKKGSSSTGYIIDRWTERLPAPEATTGVAFHFDAPSSKPPQAILLAVTPEEGMPWSDALLRRTLIETIENAQLRAVTGTELGKLGHHLPAIFAKGGLDAGPQPPPPAEENTE
ncbi:hypothetical protein LGQ03_14620 [Loktanella sp. TSTF-M6]|uniref:Uncharacterized protein n=1 Tax=Loktanella gaetbuli TaxID=2881335 RepID=A0ABS8BXQ4_9RHOB|nr:hypothetical protein [Loktanella gaetbuli]MCB5200480.1 hypothetical protein [Loktanella gaetbuli]